MIILTVLGIVLVATPIVLENMDPAPVASNIVNKPTVNYSPAPVVKEDIKKTPLYVKKINWKERYEQYRKDGLIRFEIPISEYYYPDKYQIRVDPNGFVKKLRNKGDDEPLIQSGIVTKSSGGRSTPYFTPEERTRVALLEKFRLYPLYFKVSVPNHSLVAVVPKHPDEDFYREICEACDEELKMDPHKLKKLKNLLWRLPSGNNINKLIRRFTVRRTGRRVSSVSSLI